MAATIFRLEKSINSYKEEYAQLISQAEAIKTDLKHVQVIYKSFFSIQWESEIQTSLDFQWLKRGCVAANGLDFEWDLKY